jgi:esterase/lipase
MIKTMPKARKKPYLTIVDERWQGYPEDSLPAISQLLLLQRRVRENLGLIKTPIRIFQGKLDETVDPEGAELIIDNVSSSDKELYIMQESTHCILLDKEWEYVSNISMRFINEIVTGHREVNEIEYFIPDKITSSKNN